MSVLVISQFDQSPIKSEHARLETTFSPLYVHGKFFVAQGRVTPKRIVGSG